ncbi:OmpA family protein [Nocardioides sp. W7]|uniref:OmpA family protein n=1 Tax=Nocardioides sp. W7 TaxID=2931390 RepID=UPI001FD2E4B3|nr:OmpA family protein [Nocardioides sp. W7]
MPSTSRGRGLPAILAALLTTLAALAGVTVAAAPAHAEPPFSCSFTELVKDGRPSAALDVESEVWLFTFADGDFRGWALTLDRTVPLDARALSDNQGSERLDYRVYPYGIDQTRVTYDTPYLCDISFVAEVPTEQTIGFDYPDNVRLNGTRDLVATATSGLGVSFESLTPTVCTVAGSVATGVGEGTCTVRATQPGGIVTSTATTYAAATPVERDFAVWPLPGSQSISFTQPANMRLSDSPQNLDATTDARLQVGFESLTPTTCAVQTVSLAGRAAGNAVAQRAPSPRTSTVVPVAVGECTVRATQPGNADWSWEEQVYNAATPVERTFTIRPDIAAQSITFPELNDLHVGENQAPAATATSGLQISYASATPSTCEITGVVYGRGIAPAPVKVEAKAPGTCTVTANQYGGDTGDLTYSPAPEVSESFEITAVPVEQVEPAAQTIAVTGAHGVALSSRTSPIAFASSAGLPVQVTTTTPAVCSVTNRLVRLRKAGTCTLTGAAAGNAGHLAAQPVSASFTVWRTPALPARARATRVLDVLGKGEGSLRVSATPATVCRAVRGGQVALTDAGRCTITVTTKGGDRVRSAKVRIVELRTGAVDRGDMSLAGSIRFGYRSAELTDRAKARLRRLAPKLREAKLVAVYGNTQAFGAGDTPANRKLSRQRAAVVTAFLRDLGVDAKTTTVALGSRNPAGKDEAANRRADIYWVK